MTILDIHTDSGDVITHREAVSDKGKPLGYCDADGAPWPCLDVRFFVGGLSHEDYAEEKGGQQ